MKTKIQNSDLFFLQDSRLSLAAKGLLTYLIVNPEERFVDHTYWTLDVSNSLHEIEYALEELKALQYISIVNQHIQLIYLQSNMLDSEKS